MEARQLSHDGYVTYGNVLKLNEMKETHPSEQCRRGTLLESLDASRTTYPAESRTHNLTGKQDEDAQGVET
jgi:hypothetical protein